MSTYTYNGNSSSNYIDLDEIITSQYNNYIVNGGSGDDEIADAVTEAASRITINGDGGDDVIKTYGVNDAWLAGGDGDDQLNISFIANDVSITITGGQGNDSLYVGDDYDNDVILRQSNTPDNLKSTQNSTSFSITDGKFNGTASVTVEHSVEFIIFYDELGEETVYTTEDLAQGIVKKYFGDATSTIDWWPPAPEPTPAPTPAPTPTPATDLTSTSDSDSTIEVPTDKKWATSLWKFSGKDDIINVYIDSEGSHKRKSKKVSSSHQNFYKTLFKEIEDATQLEIEFTNSDDADIIIHSTGKRGKVKKKKGYFDVNGGNNAVKRLNDASRESLASGILTCFGLDYFGKNDEHNSDDSLMSYYLSESGYNGLTVSDIAALQSLW